MAETQVAEVLETLSKLLLALQSACDSLPFSEFQHEALGLVQAQIPFDSALWATGALGLQQAPEIFSVHLFRQPQEMLTSYARVKHLDTAFAKALAQFGTTLNIALADVTWDKGSEAMKEHAERFGMQHTLSTVTRGPVTELLAAIVLYRANPANRFSERERLLQQNLVPHLASLCNRSRIQSLEAMLRPSHDRRFRAVGLVDGRGMLYNASPSFVKLVLSEWPEWRGPLLPTALREALLTHAGEKVLFEKVATYIRAVNDLYLLHMRKTDCCDSLSQREWEVASAFQNGQTHKEIAKSLAIAPGTVRNHISAIYEKLGVSNKAELIRILETAAR